MSTLSTVADFSCRDPVACQAPPVPSAESGLELVPLNATANETYREFDAAEYVCADGAKVMYDDEGNRINDPGDKFTVSGCCSI